MANCLAILEDNPDRITRMKLSAAEVFPSHCVVFFENAHELIAWLTQHLHEVLLISLDHDLPLREAEGNTFDCGDGRIVADYLAQLPPTCPVIVHSSNNDFAAGMYFALERSGWPVSRIVPFDDLEWIERDWKTELLGLAHSGWLTKTQ